MSKMCEPIVSQQLNPKFPTFFHSVYTAGDKEQFDDARSRKNLIYKSISIDSNAFRDFPPSIPWEKYKNTTARAVDNTFNYLFYKFKKGIFFQIRENRLETFLPFSNFFYFNEFEEKLIVDPSKYKTFFDLIKTINRKQQILPPRNWYSNNAMIRYDMQHREIDHNVLILKDLFETLCKTRNVPDVDLFFNRRDYPLLTIDSTEPYNHLYGTKFQPLISYNFEKYAPILSTSTSPRFADILCPTYEDWARVKYQEGNNFLFPGSCAQYPKIVSPKWSDKKPIAVFRGSTTGAGTTPSTNQRLKAFEIGLRFKDLMDIGITKWNLRPRKHETSKFFDVISRSNYPIASFLTLQQQSNYKYIINLEGHAAAYRLSYELSSGSVILLAESEWKMWYSFFLEPYIHYVPVKADLSDLTTQILWCKSNDSACQLIAQQALEFYDKYLGSAGILDFIQRKLIEISDFVGQYNYLPDFRPMLLRREREWLLTIPFSKTPHNFEQMAEQRCVGQLDGALIVFRSKTEKDLKFFAEIEMLKDKTKTCTILNFNKIFVVRKSSALPRKQSEYMHEAYIGLRAVNGLLAKCPNFMYTFGNIQGNSLDLYTEYIKGPTFNKWLESSEFNFKDYIKILVQLNLALHVGQIYCGFVHYDLYPWNVVIQQLPVFVEFDYNLGTSPIAFRCKTNIIPIMIDFGKSRAIVYERQDGMIDHGFQNLFNHHPIYDTIKILYASLKIVKHLIPSKDFTILENFASTIGIFEKPDYIVKRLDTIFKLAIGDESSPIKTVFPIDFIHYLGQYFPTIYDDFITFISLDDENEKKQFTFRTEAGNASLSAGFMKHGNIQPALLDTITFIDKSTWPISTDIVKKMTIDLLASRRLTWLNDKIFQMGDDFVKGKWKRVSKIFNSATQPIETEKIWMDYPSDVELIHFDANLTPEELETLNETISFVPNDWMRIISTFHEFILFNKIWLSRKWSDSIFMDYNAYASNNTLLLVQKLIRGDEPPESNEIVVNVAVVDENDTFVDALFDFPIDYGSVTPYAMGFQGKIIVFRIVKFINVDCDKVQESNQCQKMNDFAEFDGIVVIGNVDFSKEELEKLDKPLIFCHGDCLFTNQPKENLNESLITLYKSIKLKNEAEFYKE